LSGHDAAVLEDRDRLEAWLAEHGFVPYVDFEILTVLLGQDSGGGGGVEVDLKGNAEKILPALEDFAAQNGFLVEPTDPDTGAISLRRLR
jgi:hypothetical protein